MDVIPFVRFTITSRFALRWIAGGIILYIPGINFFSLGYLSKVSRLLMIGSIGLPTWERKSEIWFEGVKLLFVFILYNAIPFFLFSFGFFLTTLTSITAFFGSIIIKLSYVAFVLFSFLIPFAFATFSDQMDIRKALEFERIIRGIKEVFTPYIAGYGATVVSLYFCKLIIKIPYLFGFILSSLLTFYVLLVSTYFFSRLYTKTSLSIERIQGD
ncbi:MAG: DUF4013 domain-containing protein [Syntrophorhabdaceae bacterium]|nr:DUF4013 domain-containing protein [Syntrophorhabdaceae bacterium]